MDIVLSFSFCRIVVFTVSHKLISPCLALAFHTICLHCFSVSRTGMGGTEFPSISFLFLVYMWRRWVFIARAMCGMECYSRHLVLQKSLPKSLERWPAAVTSRLMLMKGSKIPRVEPITVRCISFILCLCLIKLQYTWRGDYCKCVRHSQLLPNWLK
jgi:hypothetical protein